MINQDLAKWEAAANDWHTQIAQQDTYRTHLITDALTRLIPAAQNRTVLDAGCGNGYFTNWLHERGGAVTGIDGSAQMIVHAKSSYPNLNFTVCDLLQPIPEPDHKFDLILANMLLMHMSDVTVFLSECRRLLKPDGQLIFSVLHPCFNQPTTRLYKSWLDKLLGKAPNGLAHNYYSHQTGRFESHFQTKLTHYHRTLEEYSEELATAGFAIAGMVEPHRLPDSFLKQNPKLEYATRLPRFIFFNCKPNG